jgi:hypothetical protein
MEICEVTRPMIEGLKCGASLMSYPGLVAICDAALEVEFPSPAWVRCARLIAQEGIVQARLYETMGGPPEGPLEPWPPRDWEGVPEYDPGSPGPIRSVRGTSHEERGSWFKLECGHAFRAEASRSPTPGHCWPCCGNLLPCPACLK